MIASYSLMSHAAILCVLPFRHYIMSVDCVQIVNMNPMKWFKSATRLLGYLATRLLSYSATWLLGYSATQLLSYSFTWLLGYSATRLLGYLATWLLGYSATRLLSYSATWLLGYLESFKYTQSSRFGNYGNVRQEMKGNQYANEDAGRCQEGPLSTNF